MVGFISVLKAYNKSVWTWTKEQANLKKNNTAAGEATMYSIRAILNGKAIAPKC